MGRLIRKRGKTNLSGKAGTIDYYTIGGNTYFKSHAKRHKKSSSKMAVAGRSNFASVVKLAGKVNGIKVLKEIWDQTSLKGRNSYQKLIKYNMSMAYQGNLTCKNFFTPKGYTLFIPEFYLDDYMLDFTFDIYGKIKPPFILHMIYHAYNHKTDKIKFKLIYRFIIITPENAESFRNKGELRYAIKEKLGEQDIDDISDCKDVVVLLAVTGTPSISGRKHWTSTVGFDIVLD